MKMENKKYYLVEQETNYADEFDLEGFWIQEAESEEKLKKELVQNLIGERGDFPMEIYFGSNEAVEFENENDYISTLKISEITKEEYDVVVKLFGGAFGECF